MLLEKAIARLGVIPLFWGWLAVSGGVALWAGAEVLLGGAPPLALAVALAGAQPVAVAVAVGVGWTEALRRFADGGAWMALQLAGIGPRRVMLSSLLMGVLAGAYGAGWTLACTPALYRVGASAQEAPSRLRFGEGALEPLPPAEGGGVFAAWGPWAGRARWVRWEGGAVVLGPGCAVGPEGEVCWDRWERPIQWPARRIELRERATRELAAVAARTAASGGDAAYEWMVYYKRFSHPLAILLLPGALTPWALGRRPWAALGGLAAGWWLLVRGGDGLPAAWAWAAPAWVAAWGLLGWRLRKWR